MKRTMLIPVILLLALLGAAVARLMVDDPVLSVGEVLEGLAGGPGVGFIIQESRLPVVAVGALAGAALGVSGTIFQTLLRNPLAAPDVVGVTYGASAATIAGMTLWALQGVALAALSVAGAFVAALVVLWVSRGRTTQFILVGIAVAAALQAMVSYLLTRADPRSAQEMLHWMVGSLNGSSWAQALLLVVALAVLLPAILCLLPHLSMLELGEDAARALGVRVSLVRVLLVLTAVGLGALAVSATGPIAFVAFLSGPLARLMLGPKRTLPATVIAAALVGATLVLLADLTPLPTGVITGMLGAPFLLWLLTRQKVGL